ncbi:3-ketoacyl-CoA synthase [Heracleum sosnowskyi]|uniref:3-ketoacyl-CoA synthase n=1 Tax=Heracleum sosnowskyi TaxID=360622 RepID=A0AAD8MUE4_9APIA|nr:3-ketoacyl-CoA synthase [Heracleum sosnowskyi]
MYVTRPLSYFINNSNSLSIPPEGPNSGYLVIQDENSETYSCFGMYKNTDLIHLPFPQSKNLTTRYSSGENTYHHRLAFFPVLNQPLSKNRYYVIDAYGKHKGMAYACSKEEDMTTCCFCRHVKDVKPRPFDPYDKYQQFKIVNHATKGSFYAASVARAAFPPSFLSTRGWLISSKTPKNYKLGEALGLDSTLRARLPDLGFPLSHESSEAVVVGRWYCPFIFIKDGRLSTSRDQMEKSMFYEMTLEKRWEQIFEHDNIDGGNVVMVNAVVEREVVSIGGTKAVWNEKNMIDRSCKTKWYKGYGSRREVSIGLSSEIVERMKWEEERVGWISGGEREVRVDKVEEFKGGVKGWRRFGCYVLVERFVLKRMDGSLVMTYDFKHTQQLKCMWE